MQTGLDAFHSSPYSPTVSANMDCRVPVLFYDYRYFTVRYVMGVDQISWTFHIALLSRVSKINRVRGKDSDWQGTVRLVPIVSQLTRAVRGT